MAVKTGCVRTWLTRRGEVMTERNEIWQLEVNDLLREGFGSEDIAVRLDCNIHHVRAEIRILRDSGELEAIYRKR